LRDGARVAQRVGMRSAVSCLALLAACGGDGDVTSDAASLVDASPACVPSDVSEVVTVPTIATGPGSTTIAAWRLVAALSPSRVAAAQQLANSGQRLAFLDDTGAREIVSSVDGANFRVSAGIAGGCAYLAGRHGFGRACPDAAWEPATLARLPDESDPLFAVEAGGSAWIFSQTFASFTVFERTAAGVWTEHEQFESSVSFPTDAIADTVACFISAGDRAVLAHANGRLATSAEARWCKLALSSDGQSIHVLTDIGQTTLSLAQASAQGALALAPLTAPFPTRPERLVLVGGRPHALIRGNSAIELVPLDGGAPRTLPLPDGGYLVDVDASTGAVHVVSEKVDSTGPGPDYPQTIRRQTHCL
jgi:hypothetical protein